MSLASFPSLSVFDDEEKGKKKKGRKEKKENDGLLGARAPHKQATGGNRLSRASEVLFECISKAQLNFGLNSSPIDTYHT